MPRLAAAILLAASTAWSQPYQADSRTLLLDHFDQPFVMDGKNCTSPEVFKPTAGFTGGRPMPGGEFVDGRYGKALRLHGLMKLDYPADGNLDLAAGTIDLDVALGFDAEETFKKPPSELRNQLYLTIWGPRGSRVVIYSVLKSTCLGVWDQARQLVAYTAVPGFFHTGEWHHLALKWGRRLELQVDDQQAVVPDWPGLFGPLSARPDECRISLGSHVGSSGVVSEFALDELRVLGPGGEQVPDYPIVTAPRLAAPTIDGEIGEREWAAAARTTGFVGLNDPSLVSDQTMVYLGWDDTALYVAGDCRDPEARPIVAALTERDSAVWTEDAVDVFLSPGPELEPYYQLIASAAGTRFDARLNRAAGQRVDLTFNPDWTAAAKRARGRWTMEARIPFGALDGRATPQDGERWRVNFCRDAEGSRLSSWAYTSGNFHRPASFGELIFSRSDRAIRLGLSDDWAIGHLTALAEMTGLTFQPPVTVRGRLVGNDAKALHETTNRLADYRAATFEAPPLVTGAYQLTIRADTDAGPLYYQRLPLKVAKSYDIAVAGYPYEGKLWVTANVAGLDKPPAGLVARSELLNGEQVVGRCEIREFVRGRGQASLAIDQLPPGKYLVKSQAVAPDGQVLGSAEAAFEQMAKPAWWRSPAGADHSVPSPWTPVRAGADGTEVWGRRYSPANRALPARITSQGAELLAAPISLSVTADGQTADLAGVATVVTKTRPDVLRAAGETKLGNLTARVATATEFDGLQRYDLTLTPTGTATLTAATLEIPMPRGLTPFMLVSNGDTSPVREVGDQLWQSAFQPQVWLGNDDVGLAWFAESDQHWAPLDAAMIEVQPAGDRTVLRCRMVRQAVKLERPITYTFGLMATPVKDGHAGDPFWIRFGSPLGPYDRVDDPSASRMPIESLRYPAAGNVDASRGTIECFVAPHGPRGGAWRDLLRVTGPDGGLAVTWQDAAPPVLKLDVRRGDQTRTLSVPKAGLEAGRFAHLAVTWEKEVAVYLDGRRLGAVDLTPPTGTAIVLGSESPWRGWTSFVFDELRVSRSVRYTGDRAPVPAEAFAPDQATLLLDHLDGGFRPDGEDAETRATTISGQSGELGGLPSIGCTFVAGRFGQGLQVAVEPAIASTEAFRRWGNNAALYWWWFEDGAKTYGWPPPLMIDPPSGDPRALLKRFGELGIRVAPYMGYTGIGAPSDLSRQFGAEWRREPLSSQPAEPPKGHFFLDCCGNSGYADYIAAGTDWLVNELGYQACYTDGNARVYACRNTHHGCGYTMPDGTLRSTWPIFGTREYLKRMFRVLKAKDPSYFLVNHVSYNMLIPTMSFTDVVYSGEHEQYEDPLKFRVRWQSKPWGLWTILLGPDSHSYEALHNTWCLLHGVSVWPQGALGRNDMLRKTVNLWQTYDRFGYREAEWRPYYAAEDLARAADEQVKVSLYRHPKGRALLVVGNLKHEVVMTTITLDLKALGVSGKQAANALDGRALPLKGNQLTVRLRPTSFVLAWVE